MAALVAAIAAQSCLLTPANADAVLAEAAMPPGDAALALDRLTAAGDIVEDPEGWRLTPDACAAAARQD